MSKVENNKKINLLINICITTLIFILFLLRKIYNFDLILLFFSIILLLLLFNSKPDLFIKYFSSFFYCIYMNIGVFLCNNTSIYLYEIEKKSHYNGSFALAILYFIIYFAFLIIFDKKLSKKIKYSLPKKNKSLNIIYYIFFFIGLIMFLFVVKYPSFSLNLDRFYYEAKYLPKWIVNLQGNIVNCVPFLLFPIILNNEKFNVKKVIKIILVLFPFILYGIWTGNKFGLFFRIFILLAAPIIIYIEKGNLSTKKNDELIVAKKPKKIKGKLKKVIFLSIAMFIVILFPYYFLRGFNFYDSMINRAAQQGQLWWATFEIEQYNPMHLSELQDEIIPIKETIKGEDISYSYGVYKIMRIVMSQSKFKRKLLTGSRYATQGIESAFYYFKYIGIVIHPIIRAFVEVLFINLLVKYTFSGRFIETYTVCRIFLIEHFIFTQGDLYLLFSKGTIFFTVLSIVLELINRSEEKKSILLVSNDST